MLDHATFFAYPSRPAAAAAPEAKATLAKVSASLVALGAASYLALY